MALAAHPLRQGAATALSGVRFVCEALIEPGDGSDMRSDVLALARDASRLCVTLSRLLRWPDPMMEALDVMDTRARSCSGIVWGKTSGADLV